MRAFAFASLLLIPACSSSPPTLSPTSGDMSGTPPISCRTFLPHAGSPHLLGSDLPRAMGAFVATNCPSAGLGAASFDPSALQGLGDDLYLPVLPLFAMDQTFVAPPKIIKVDKSGTVSDFYVFPDSETFSFSSGFFAQVTVDGKTGTVPRGLSVSVVADGSGNVYYANSLGSVIYKFDAMGNRSAWVSDLPNVLNLAIGPDHSIYAVTGALYNDSAQPPSLLTAPAIYTLDSDGNRSLFYTLPSSYNYSTGFGRGSGQPGNMMSTPMGLVIDLAFDGAGGTYVVVNMAGVVLKLSPATMANDGGTDDGGIDDGGTSDGGASSSLTEIEYVANIPGASGIVAAPDGRLLVAAAPLFAMDQSYTRLPQIVAVATDKTTSTFYQGTAHDEYKTGFFTSQGITQGAYPIDAVFKLNLDANGNVFYEDNLTNSLTLIPTM